MCVCARTSVLGVCVCVTVHVAANPLLVDSVFVCLTGDIVVGCVCVSVGLSGCLSLCLAMLVSVDLLALSSSTCITMSLPHNCLGGEKRVLTLLVVSGSLLACLDLFDVGGLAHKRSKFHW